MYLQRFSLVAPPFDSAPDNRFIYRSESFERALESMNGSLIGRDCLGVVTGEPGAGKSTLLHRFLASLDPDTPVAPIADASLGERELLRAVLTGFGFDPLEGSIRELRNIVTVFLRHQTAQERLPVLVVEDAQAMCAHALDTIRWLAGLEHEGRNLLAVLLSGPPELNRVVDSPGMAALTGRTRVRVHVDALEPEETRGYIAHRLAAAGSADPAACFAGEAVELIHEYSRGLPGRIDRLCESALESAADRQQQQAGVADVEAAVRCLAREPAYAQSCGAGPRAWLVVSLAGEPLGRYPLSEERAIVGRDKACEIHLDGRFISRHHAMLVHTRGGYRLVDLNSTNGTYLNGKPITQRALNDGDAITIGHHRLEYSSAGAAAQPVADSGGFVLTDVLQPITEGERARPAARRTGGIRAVH